MRRAPTPLLPTALAVLLLAAPARAAPPFDPDVDPAGDVEPGAGGADDLEPPPDDVEPPGGDPDVEPGDLGDDVEPPGTAPDQEGDDLDAQRERRDAIRRRTLPPDGLGDRPSMPRIDYDLMYFGEGSVGQGAGALSWNRYGEDDYLFLVLGAVLVKPRWAIAPRLPLRFRMKDRDPKTPDVIRREDWDDGPSEWSRVLAFFQYGHVGDPFYLRYGELNGATVGHGSFVNRYYNFIDIDHYQGGLYTYVDAGFFGAEGLVDNIFDVLDWDHRERRMEVGPPDVLVARPFVRPLSLFPALPFALEKLKVGLTLGGDFNAPLRMATDEDGRLLRTADDYEPIVLESGVVPFLGLDLEVPVVSKPHLDVVPYLDLNTLDLSGGGVHVGTYLTVRFDPLNTWASRVEYRFAGPGYLPSYVNPVYEIKRIAFRDGRPKLAWLRDHDKGSGVNGFYLESDYNLVGRFRFTFVFSEDEGPDNSDLLLRLRLPELGPARLSIFFGRFGFDGLRNFFDPNDTILSIGGRYNFFDAFFVKLRVGNEWRFRVKNGTGSYETRTTYDVGVGLLIRL